jgi:predicted nuclease of predicted toxin-antitoxin system
VAAIRIYTDESVDVAVAAGLKRRGVDEWSARDVGNLGLSDEEQLRYASFEQAVIFSHDADFLRFARHWTQQGIGHTGIIYVQEQKLGVGECVRRLLD